MDDLPIAAEATAPSSLASTRPPCRYFFASPSGCFRGAACAFSHIKSGDDNSAASANLSAAETADAQTDAARLAAEQPAGRGSIASETQAARTPMRQCKWFAAGYCHRGAQCWFAHTHEGDNLRQNGSTSSSSGTPLRTAPGLSAMAPVFSPSAPTIASGSDSIDYGENNADASGSNILVSSGAGRAHSVAEAEAKALEGLHEMPACGICLEKPVTYGLLEHCSHVFCLDCIREWRRTKEKDEALVESGVVKQCPACRARSHFITPSSTFHPAGPAKDAAIERYKSSMARKPCKHFDRSKDSLRGPWCPFGDDCFFAHALEPGGERYRFESGAEEMMRSGIRRYGGFGTRFSGLSRVERMARSLGRSGEIETLSQALQAFVRAFQTEYGAWDLEDAGEGRLHHNGAISWSPVESVDGDLDEHGAGSSDVLGDFARHYEAEHGHELDLSYFESEEHDHEESDAGSESGDIFGLRRAFLYGYERGGEASDVEVEGSDYGEEHWNDDHPGWFGHLHEVIGPASWQDASSEDGAQNAGPRTSGPAPWRNDVEETEGEHVTLETLSGDQRQWLRTLATGGAQTLFSNDSITLPSAFSDGDPDVADVYGDGDGAHLVRVWRSWRSGAPSPPSSWGSGSDSGVGEGEGGEEGGEEEGEEGGDEVVSVGAFADGRDGAEEDELELDLEFRDEEYDQEGDVDEYEGEEGDETLDW